MANDYVFNDSLPVAPLKIAALESCRELAAQVNDHIVQFRRNDIEELKRRQVHRPSITTRRSARLPISMWLRTPKTKKTCKG